MKSKVVWIVLSLIILLFSAVTILVIKIVPSKRQMTVPQSMESVQDFVDKHSNIIIYKDVSDIVPEAKLLKNQEVLASSLPINNNQVQFLVSKLSSKVEAREFFNTCMDKLKGNIQIASLDFCTSNYYYWTAIVNGEKIYLWQKDEWVVLMKGDNSNTVKALKHEFEDKM